MKKLSSTEKTFRRFLLISKLLLITLFLNAFTSNAQINFSVSYNQNFDALASSGSGNSWTNGTSPIPGWYLYRQPAPGTDITTYNADNGGSNAGSFNSFGSTGSSERALGGTASGGAYFGSPASGAIAGWIAAAFNNSSGSTINSVTVGFDGEQWRNGGNTSAQTMVLEYGFGATFAAVSTWTAPGGNFDWASPVIGASAAAVNGNVAGLVSGRGGSLNSLNWTSGSTLWIRWIERNDPGNDHGLAIDNFSLTTAVSTTPTVDLSVSTNAASETAQTAVTVTVTASAAVTGNQTVDLNVSGTNITSGDYTLSNTTITIPDGATMGSATFTVVDDAISEGAETAILTISNPSSGISLGGTTTQNITIADNDITATKISSIQGNGLTFNPGFGGTQTIEGIVVGNFEGNTKLNGFYVEEEDADMDGDPATAEGIFVYDPSGLFSGSIGTKVQVSGTVSEYTSSASNIAGTGSSSLTELTATSVSSLGAAALPTVINVTLPVADASDLEPYEGMLINISAANGNLVVTETFKLGRYGQVGLSVNSRLDQYTQVNPPSVPGYNNYVSNLLDRYIILDDGSTFQNPDPEIFARGGNPLSASNTLRGGDEISSISGVLDERFEGYRVQTTTPANFLPANPRMATPPVVGGYLKTGFFNVLNYFTDLDQGSTISIPNGVSFQPRGANTPAEFTRQRDKIVSAITTLNPDVLGVSEIENDGNKSIQDLVNGLNAIAGANTYNFVNDQALINDPNPAINAVGTDAIKVAIIYKPGSVTPVGSPSTYQEPSPSSPIFSRPPVAQTFMDASGNKFTIIVNHLKSKGSSAGLSGDADQGDGQGFSNATRVAQAQALLSFTNTVKANSGDSDVLVIGDLNSYAMEDPITTLKNGGLTNLFDDTSYSYQFNGQWGSLDHALASATLSNQVAGTAHWHINSDEPVVLDYNTEFKSTAQISSFYNPDGFRSSDHDAVLVGLNLANTTAPSITITSPANNSTFAAGDSVAVTATISSATSPVTKVAFYNYGSKFAEDNNAPYAVSGMDVEPGTYLVTAIAFFSNGDSAISDTVHITVTGCNGSGSITGEGYSNIPGSQVANLTSSPKYPGNPDVVASLNKFEYGPNYGDNYGASVRGFICAPVTGNYTFYIAGDDQAGLWLSTDEDSAHKVLIAYNISNVNPRAWYTYASQKSAPIRLIKGARYYIETLHKEATGADHLAVAWQIPGGAFEGPIPGSRLSPIGSVFPNVPISADFGIAMEKVLVKEKAGRFSVTATPNPSSSYFTLHTSSNSEEAVNIIVTDAAGRVVIRKDNNPANGIIQIGQRLRGGIYFVEVIQGAEKKRLKLIKE